ncbi:6-phospho-beta-glucosidase [Clostridium polynesiense]|uniref:6-phospho-beta-glucosidase n=1 Tax=Clostridium polynesiense TaxID=1325933 RepID=UPI00058E8393|nr:6-phospho-beta-glucosidase [Clostridium polynesiense]
MSKKGLKIVTIGGGSSYTPELIEGFIKRYDELPVKDIYLVDVEEGKEKLEIVGNLAKRMVEKSGLDINIHLTLDRREAIKDADFVTTQFRVGQLDARIKDESLPLKYGVIGQETTGPGGFAKGLRTIPVILDICKDIEELCPNAWLINFTNPSGMVTEAVAKYTKVKNIGLCNVPIGMRSGAAKIMDVSLDRISMDYVGLNHLVWATNVYLDGKNITAEVVEKMAQGSSMSMKNISNYPWEPEFIRSLGMVPCGYLRYYYQMDKMVEEAISDSKEKGTRGVVVKKVEEELFELYKDKDLDIKPPQLEQRGGAHYSDAACSLISSIYNNKKDIQTVNTVNNGAISDLPDNVVIEANCVIDKYGAHPINIGHISPKIRGLIHVVKSYEELAIEAAVHGDYHSALQALTVHPLVPSSAVAKKILDEILEQNKDYLPQFK